jgi:hypothetical protein
MPISTACPACTIFSVTKPPNGACSVSVRRTWPLRSICSHLRGEMSQSRSRRRAASTSPAVRSITAGEAVAGAALHPERGQQLLLRRDQLGAVDLEQRLAAAHRPGR